LYKRRIFDKHNVVDHLCVWCFAPLRHLTPCVDGVCRINAQQHWMDLSLECDKQWKSLGMTMEERRASLLSTVLKLIAAAHGAKSKQQPPPGVEHGPPSQLLLWWLNSFPGEGDAGRRVLDAFLVIADRFSETTADGFNGVPAVEVAQGMPDGWLSSGAAAERYPACLIGSITKMSTVWSELSIKAGTEEARVLLGDAVEGYARGMMGNMAVGPFFAEVAEHIKRVL
jgi:hypothetical protein